MKTIYRDEQVTIKIDPKGSVMNFGQVIVEPRRNKKGAIRICVVPSRLRIMAPEAPMSLHHAEVDGKIHAAILVCAPLK